MLAQADLADAPAEPSSPQRRPAIVAVDDEPAVLAAVARDLRLGFGERFRILRAASGDEALEILRELRGRGDQIAMLIADQRMPGMPGTQYLVEARKIVPDVKRVLLTAYADTEAAIAAINEVALDYYLLKPWDPPEEQLFPVVEDLLTTWEAGAACPSRTADRKERTCPAARTSITFSSPTCPRLSMAARTVCSPATRGCTCASAWSAGTSAAATIRPTATPARTATPAAIRSSARSSRAKTGRGAS
jgi:CheY-like chemotaxis protein